MRVYRQPLLISLMLLGLSSAAQAVDNGCPGEAVQLSEIRFRGNQTTRPRVLLREMRSAAGAITDAQTLRADAERIRDLGLFRHVEVRCVLDTSGWVAEFDMREKYYLLIAPRSDANSDGDYSYGLHLSWHNALGLNHTIRGTVLQRRTTQSGRGDALEYRIAHHAPYVFGSRYDLSWSMAHEIAELSPAGGSSTYEQVDNQLRIGVDRHLGHGPASQGWRIGAAYTYRQRQALEQGPDLGTAHALSLGLKYRQRHNFLFSETGLEAQLEGGHASTALGSDYTWSYLNGTLSYDRPLGRTAHQTLGLQLETQLQFGGPDDGLNQYSLGGASLLRGYPRNIAEGDAYALLRLEAYRPLHWQWLRWGGFVEAGAAWGGDEAHTPGLLASAGLGLQIRPSWFVGLVIDLGFGIPLIARDTLSETPAFYGSGR